MKLNFIKVLSHEWQAGTSTVLPKQRIISMLKKETKSQRLPLLSSSSTTNLFTPVAVV